MGLRLKVSPDSIRDKWSSLSNFSSKSLLLRIRLLIWWREGDIGSRSSFKISDISLILVKGVFNSWVRVAKKRW